MKRSRNKFLKNNKVTAAHKEMNLILWKEEKQQT